MQCDASNGTSRSKKLSYIVIFILTPGITNILVFKCISIYKACSTSEIR